MTRNIVPNHQTTEKGLKVDILVILSTTNPATSDQPTLNFHGDGKSDALVRAPTFLTVINV
ncbi:hypothetical protein BOTNAR_0290g00170 [Botryotinia narcissicola]|uniref:Uncharacterized protein n=1 Tax=Botryotinia narcissicola TaxID=278944 RepID=A0A4Z1HXA2_9HELO|nr:hypothetical protein BOTNAR_0290g00170 [Botryotinia narcissicola]